MNWVRMGAAFAAGAITTYVTATVFYTQQVLAKQAAIGAVFTATQKGTMFASNLSGLWLYGLVLSVALAVGFVVAAVVKRWLKPLARVAYPVAGAAAVLAAIFLIEAQLGGGAGVMGGARDSAGLALQALAGALGGLVFALLRPVRG